MGSINPLNYILADREEKQLRKELRNLATESEEYSKIEQELRCLQEEHRGICYADGDPNKFQINPVLFSEYFFQRCKMFCVGSNHYYAYNRKVHRYEIVNDRTIKKIARKILAELDERYYSPPLGSKIYKAITEDVEEKTELSPTEGVIVFQNGTLYTRLESEKKMRFSEKFSSKNIVLYTLPYAYNPQATCPKFMKFLDECMRGDKELIALLRDCCANIFAFGQVYIHHIVFFYGIGRNGKSVLCDLLDYLFPEMVSHIHLSKLSEHFGCSAMVDKVLNISPESEVEIKNTEKIKEISAGSTIDVEYKFQDSFSTRITAKLFVSTNCFPHTTDASKGWQDRLTIIPFEQVFEVLPVDGQKEDGVYYQNPHLLEELKEEREGIAAWLIKGLQELKERNWILAYSERANKLKQKVILDSQPVRLFFISCVVKCPSDDKKRIRTSEVHSNFKAWAEHNEIDTGKFHDSRSFHKEFRRILTLKQCDAEPREIHGHQHYVDIEIHKRYLSRICYE